MNLRRTASKLQTALLQKGRCVKLHQLQGYSDKNGNLYTQFRLVENGKTVLETYKLIEVVMKLAEMYGECDDA